MKSIRSILVTTDLTEASDEVLKAAAALANLADATLHIIHALDFQPLPYTHDEMQPMTFQGHIAGARKALDEQIRRSLRPDVEVGSREVIIYVAHKAILDRARDVSADLIVLGPHRKRSGGGPFLGSTADRVIRTAQVPCLVVRGPLSLPLRRVLVPIDLSSPALGALDVALEWANSLRPHPSDPQTSPELRVLHVIPRVFDFEDVPVDRASITADLHTHVERANAKLGGSAPIAVREEVRWGDTAAEEILRTIVDEHVDLVVLGTHGYGAVRRALIGSVASAVARASTCPVLLVPPALWKTANE